MAAGQSKDTRDKEEMFSKILGTLMTACRGIIPRRGRYPRFVYLDLNAGPGILDGDLAGSPPRAWAAASAQRPHYETDLWLFERDPDAASALRALFRSEPHAQIVEGDHREAYRLVLDRYRSLLGPLHDVYGLSYFDPNCDVLPIEALRALTGSDGFRQMDVLCYVNSNGAYKRTRSAHPDRYFASDVEAVGKRYWWLRDPRGRWQWTFALGSNWRLFPEFRADGFVELGSERGRAILEELNYTKTERRLLRQYPFEDWPLIAPTPSTSGTLPSSPYEPRLWRGPADDASAAG